MVRVVVGGAGSLVEAGVVVGIGAGVEVATAVVGTDVVGFVAGVGTAVTSEVRRIGCRYRSLRYRCRRSGRPVGTIVALGTETMVVGAVVASMRSGVSVVIWPEASVAVSSSMASDFAGGLVPTVSGVGAGPEQARRPISSAMVAATNVFLNPSCSFFSDNCSIAPLIPDSPLVMPKSSDVPIPVANVSSLICPGPGCARTGPYSRTSTSSVVPSESP